MRPCKCAPRARQAAAAESRCASRAGAPLLALRNNRARAGTRTAKGAPAHRQACGRLVARSAGARPRAEHATAVTDIFPGAHPPETSPRSGFNTGLIGTIPTAIGGFTALTYL